MRLASLSRQPSWATAAAAFSAFALLIASVAVEGAAVRANNEHEYIPGRAFNRFVTIWLENQDYDLVSQNPSIQALSQSAITLTNYYGLTHPSQPNYLASIAGDYFGLNHDRPVELDKKVLTLVDLFEDGIEGGRKKIEWKGYFEGIPGPGYMFAGSTNEGGLWDYVRKHNPFVSFNSISHYGARLWKTQSLSSFYRDIMNEQLPQYFHISPDMNNDGHNSSLDFAAYWSNRFLQPLLANEYFMKDTLVLLTYDESATYEKPNHIVSLLLGGAVPDNLKGTTDDTFYTHYSILSTIQNNWELPNLGRFDVGANVFKMVADKTGYKGNYKLTAKEQAEVDLSVSNGGELNDDPNMVRPIPPPNMGLIGAGGKGVLDKMKKLWSNEANAPTPYNGKGKVWEPVLYGPQGPPAS